MVERNARGSGEGHGTKCNCTSLGSLGQRPAARATLRHSPWILTCPLPTAPHDLLRRHDARRGHHLRVGLPHQRGHGQHREVLQDDGVRAPRRSRHRAAELGQPGGHAGGDRRAQPALRRRRHPQPLERRLDVRGREARRRRDARHRAARRRLPRRRTRSTFNASFIVGGQVAGEPRACSASTRKATSSRRASTRPTSRPARPSTASRSSTA